MKGKDKLARFALKSQRRFNRNNIGIRYIDSDKWSWDFLIPEEEIPYITKINLENDN